MTPPPKEVKKTILTRITDTFGSVKGVYVQFAVEVSFIVIFGYILGVDKYPFQLLTLVLSLQAITMTQLVMIVQNRQGALAEVQAAHDRQNNAADLLLDEQEDRKLTMLLDHFGLKLDPETPVLHGEAVEDAHAMLEEAEQNDDAQS